MSTSGPQVPPGANDAARARPSRPVVPVWKRPLYALVVLVVAGAAAELAARLFVTDERLPLLAQPTDGSVNLLVPEVFAYDPELFWVLRPNLRLSGGTVGGIRTNALGMRSDFEVAPAKSRPRVLCLGDSCTYGFGVQIEDAWPSRIDAEFESVNAGVPGYTSHQGVVYLGRLAPLLAPDCVVVGFGANDATDWTSMDRGRVVALTDRERARHVALRELLTRSRFFGFVLSLGSSKPVPVAELDAGDLSKLPPRVPLEDFRANIRSLADAAPSAVLLAWPRRCVLSSAFADPVPRERAEGYYQAVLDFAREGRRVVDVAEVMRENDLSVREFYADDVHATAVGSRAVGSAVADAVRKALATRQ